MKSTRNEIDQELSDILGYDADPMIQLRGDLRRQLDTQAFRPRTPQRNENRSPSTRRTFWIAGVSGALATIAFVIMIVSPFHNQQVPIAKVTDGSGLTTTSQQQNEAETSEVDDLIAETLQSSDDVWDQAEVDIAEMISNGTRSR